MLVDRAPDHIKDALEVDRTVASKKGILPMVDPTVVDVTHNAGSKGSVRFSQTVPSSTSAGSTNTHTETRGKRRAQMHPSKQVSGQTIGNYQLGKTIGKGNFAKVKLANHLLTGTQVAVKIIDKTVLTASSMTKIFREVRIMKMLDHPNIIKLYEVIDTQNTLYLVLEYASGGELFDFLVSHGKMKENEARQKFRQILSAVQYCHSNMVIHRDLKAENLLLDSNMNIKIADFGFSNQFVPGSKLDTFCGSPPYAAPELFQGKKYEGPEVDVWSLGVILYTLVSGSLPFDGSNLKELRERVLRGKYRIPFYMSTECEQLLRKFLVLNPLGRSTLRKALKDKWVNNGCTTMLEPYEGSSELVLDQEIDTTITAKLERMGFQSDHIEDSLKRHKYNDVTSTYLLLKEQANKAAEDTENKDDALRAFPSTSASTRTPPMGTPPDSKKQHQGDQPPRKRHQRRYTENTPRSKTPSSMVDAPTSNRASVAISPPSGYRAPIGESTNDTPGSRSQTNGISISSVARPRGPHRRAQTYGNTPEQSQNSSTNGVPLLSQLKAKFGSKKGSAVDNTGAKPRSLRFTFNMQTTSDKSAPVIIEEIQKALVSNNVEYAFEDAYFINCTRGEVQWEMEVCKLPRLSGMHGVRFKRIAGNSVTYKNLCSDLITQFNL